MAKYSQNKINQLNQQQEMIYQKLAQLMHKGIKDSEVQATVHEARMFINDNWYECSLQQFARLGEMYVSDERFKKNIDKSGDGLAEFLNEAIKILSTQS